MDDRELESRKKKLLDQLEYDDHQIKQVLSVLQINLDQLPMQLKPSTDGLSARSRRFFESNSKIPLTERSKQFNMDTQRSQR